MLPPGSKDVAIYNSSINGNDYSGTLEEAGAYTIRVYLMRNEARRGVQAAYTLNVGIADAAASGDTKVAGTKFHATGHQMPKARPLVPAKKPGPGLRRKHRRTYAEALSK